MMMMMIDDDDDDDDDDEHGRGGGGDHDSWQKSYDIWFVWSYEVIWICLTKGFHGPTRDLTK